MKYASLACDFFGSGLIVRAGVGGLPMMFDVCIHKPHPVVFTFKPVHVGHLAVIQMRFICEFR